MNVGGLHHNYCPDAPTRPNVREILMKSRSTEPQAVTSMELTLKKGVR
jgi:hypothetical protein